MCPYARFQSVMFDRDTLVVSYDRARGEPRRRGARRVVATWRPLGRLRARRGRDGRYAVVLQRRESGQRHLLRRSKVAGAVAIVQEAAISEYGQALSPSQFEYLLSVSAHDAVEGAPVVDIDAMVASLQDGYAFMA